MVDARGLGPREATRGGSIPSARTACKKERVMESVQVSQVSENTVARVYRVFIAQQDFQRHVLDALKKREKRNPIPHFRPGKAPVEMLKARYGSLALKDALHSVSEYGVRCIRQQTESLKTVGSPEVRWSHLSEESDFECTISLHCFPTITQNIECSTFSIVSYKAVINDEVVQKGLADQVKKSQEPKTLAEARPAQTGDRVRVDVTVVNGAGVVQNIQENQWLTADETPVGKLLLGVSAGETVETRIRVRKSKNGQATKNVLCKLAVLEVAESGQPDINDDWARSLGHTDLEALYAFVKESMEQEAEQWSLIWKKKQLFEELCAAFPLELPTPLVENERERIWNVVVETCKKETGIDLEKLEGQERTEALQMYTQTDEEKLNKALIGIAQQRAHILCLLEAFCAQQNVQITSEEIQNVVWTHANQNVERMAQLIAKSRQNPSIISDWKREAIEEKVVRLMLETVSFQDESIDFEELSKKLESYDWMAQFTNSDEAKADFEVDNALDA